MLRKVPYRHRLQNFSYSLLSVGLKKYRILSLIGDGTYGLVYLALNSETREKVAIKTMKKKYGSWDEVMDLREVKSLKKLHHPNVVKLKEVSNVRIDWLKFSFKNNCIIQQPHFQWSLHNPRSWILNISWNFVHRCILQGNDFWGDFCSAFCGVVCRMMCFDTRKTSKRHLKDTKFQHDLTELFLSHVQWIHNYVDFTQI